MRKAMRINLTTLNKMVADGDKITMLTCYDASFAAVLDAAGVDTLLIGDSLGMDFDFFGYADQHRTCPEPV